MNSDQITADKDHSKSHDHVRYRMEHKDNMISPDLPEIRHKNLEYLLLVKSKRKLLLWTGSLVFMLSFVISIVFFTSYTSTISFVVDESKPENMAVSEPERFVLAQLTELNKNRLFYTLFSDLMAKRLDESIGLGRHHKIDPGSKNYLQSLVRIMMSQVEFQKSPLNVVYISIKDRDEKYAMLMANTIFMQLEGIHKDQVAGMLEYKQKHYLNNVQYYQAKKNLEIDTLIRVFNRLPLLKGSSSENTEEIIQIKRDINNKLIDLYSNQQSVINNRILYDYAKGTLNDSTIKTLFLINSAGISSRGFGWGSAFGFSLLITLAVQFYIILSIYAFRKYGHLLKLFMNKP